MSVSREEVRKIARLAELHVDEAALPTLAAQLSGILEYVAQISGVPATDAVKAYIPGPTAIRFRADEVRPAPLAFGASDLAPVFREGFFLVPRLDAFGAAHGVAEEDLP